MLAGKREREKERSKELLKKSHLSITWNCPLFM
jgi:hypothetical protein